MLDNVTRLCQYDMTTPIQAYTIPAVLQGHDVVGIAQTGKFVRPLRLAHNLHLVQVLAKLLLT